MKSAGERRPKAHKAAVAAKGKAVIFIVDDRAFLALATIHAVSGQRQSAP
jgi:hypothetical protein